jgi:hypothetical protein
LRRRRSRPRGLRREDAYGGVTQLHKVDDGVHFCLGDESTWERFFTCGGSTKSPGIVRYGMRVAADANRWLGL